MEVVDPLVEIWPLFGIRIRTPRLELRLPRDADLAGLVDLIERGIHDPSFMPFRIPWTDGPAIERNRRSCQHWWSNRATLSPQLWDLGFIVFADGEPMGVQDLRGKDFPILRQAGTGSWLGSAFQGRGYGKEMRAAIVHFAFEALGASSIVSAAFIDNGPSQSVSLATGYEFNGVETTVRRGEPVISQRFRLTRERWEASRPRLEVMLEGWTDGCREMLGLCERPSLE